MLAEAGLLNDDRPSGGEITDAAVAKPSRIQPDVLVLRHGELAFRALDVIAIHPVIDAHLQWRNKSPAISNELGARVLLLDVGRELKCLARFLWGGDEAQELA